ncbi:bL28 family ribosomal protein [Streptomyces sp. NPDC059355]|uniref:large ribosomal subunit protein bL28 n=1 Tax=Streptomyces sp. NPDC059355 TaxID=3346811 RepID=UPI0036A2C184
MSAHCQLTGAQPGFGNNSRYVRLKLSAKAIKTVDTIGVEAAVARIRARGVKV